MPVRIKPEAVKARITAVKEYKKNKPRRQWYIFRHNEKFQEFVDFYYAQKTCGDTHVVIWRKVPKSALNRVNAALNAILGG